MARIYAEEVSTILKQRVVVENRPTASGAHAASAVQNSAPDGYTLLIFSAAQHVTIPAISETAAYDPIKGVQPITLLFDVATVLAVPVSSSVASFHGLLEYGKSRSDGLTFGSPGVGTPSHLTGAKLMAATGTPAQYVHYRGGAPMMADLLPGRLDAAVLSTPLAKPYLQDNRLRAVALDAPARWSPIPDVPTLAELGLGEATVAGWFGVATTPGTPQDIIAKLHAAFTTAAQNPELIRRVVDNGLTVRTSTPDAMSRLLLKEAAVIGDLVRSLGLIKR
jgi:tripartite-type tricarboxylate transporter receptor subunit TctC